MSTTMQPPAAAPKNVNRLGFTMADYKGADSTLCAGCGHDAITSQIIKAFYEYGVEPHRVAKLSGIGCSSKTPAYFLSKSHGFNGVHGRMPALGTGVMLANKSLVSIGVSGDGDTASIGMGQFVHLLRRNVPMIYIIENNGVYGLTKGQFSATADLGSNHPRRRYPRIRHQECRVPEASRRGAAHRSGPAPQRPLGSLEPGAVPALVIRQPSLGG